METVSNQYRTIRANFTKFESIIMQNQIELKNPFDGVVLESIKRVLGTSHYMANCGMGINIYYISST